MRKIAFLIALMCMVSKASILYAQTESGTLKAIVKDTEFDEVAINGNEISLSPGKYASVSERRFWVMHQGKLITVPFVERTEYNGMDDTSKITYVNAKGKK